MANEHFEERQLSGQINIRCKYDDGTERVWSESKMIVCQRIKQIIDDYQEQGYTLTLRQLHYQLVTRNWIVNHTSAYKKLGNILDDMRYSGVIDWDAIEDRGRVPYLPYWVTGINHAIADTINNYRLDLQKGQDNYIELWTEKDALSGILRRSTQRFHIQLVVNKGYTSSTAIYAAYQRFIERIQNGRKVIILYFGDHDPSGLDMVRDIRERLSFMFEKGDYAGWFDGSGGGDYIEDSFQIKHIGLTKEQIRQYKPPANPTKVTDSRADKYIKIHGKTCWEVDALDPKTLTEIVEKHIIENIDVGMFNEMVRATNADIETIKEKFKNF